MADSRSVLFGGMLHRTNNSYYKVAIQDGSGNTAPTMFIAKQDVPGNPGEEKTYKALIKMARERSGLGRFTNWNFR